MTALSLARLFLFVFFMTSLTVAEPVADGFYIVSETTPVDRYVGTVTYLYTIHRRPEHVPFIIARCGDGSCKALFRNLEDNVKTDK